MKSYRTILKQAGRNGFANWCKSCPTVACEAQTYFRSSLLFGGREATTGNTSAFRRLVPQFLIEDKKVCNLIILTFIDASEKT